MNGTDHGRTALILYGTETGTAQDLAEELGRLTERLRFSTLVIGLDDIAANELPNYTITVFVIATTGQGDFPDNARTFWMSILKKKLSHDFLGGVHYALAGLGDSSYPKFNWAARKLEKRLQQLGAEAIMEPCEADEQGDDGTDGAFLGWLENLQEMLLLRFPLPDGREPVPRDQPLPSRWQLLEASPRINGYHEGLQMRFPSSAPDHDTRPIPESITAVLQRNERVTPSDHWQDVRLLDLSIDGSIEYMPGDALSIVPKNFSIDVDALVSLMDWTALADIPIALNCNADFGGTAQLPIPYWTRHREVTLRILLTEYLDITTTPRRSFFAGIARYAKDELQRERLVEFTDPQYLDEYYDYATRPRRSILEILQDFDSVCIPWNEAINIFPLIRPRQFSIASGGFLKQKPDGGIRVELLVAVVKYRTVIKKIREGICTRYLAALLVGSTMNVVLRNEGRFHSKNGGVGKNHLLIGAGTGIAPLRSLIYEQQQLNLPLDHGSSTTLIFGSRGKDVDYFFGEEWARLASARTKGAGLQIITAFSRDQKTKVYVQDRIRGNAEAVIDLICNRNATVIVCGSSGQMPKAVREALLNTLLTQASKDPVWTRDHAEQYLSVMEKQGRYKQETW